MRVSKICNQDSQREEISLFEFWQKIRLDPFLISYISGTKDFTELVKCFKIFGIVLSGKSQVECGFSTNAKLLVENQNTEILTVQRIIHDHMRLHKHQLHIIKVTVKKQNHVKQAWGRYFNNQQERSLIAVKSARDEKIKQIKEYISSINKNIFQTQGAIETIKVVADAYVFEPEISLSCGISFKSLLL